MADEVTVTAADVRPSPDADVKKMPIAQVAITAGQALYVNGTNGTNKAQATTTIADDSNRCVGVAVKGAAIGEVVEAIVQGLLHGFTGLTPGKCYVLSEDVAGGIKEYANIAQNDTQVIIGHARDATTMLIDVQDTLARKP